MSKEIAETPVIFKDEIAGILELNESELNTVCICRKGCARSWIAADLLNELGYNARFIEGGMEEIFARHLNGEKITDILSKVPNLIIILEEIETRRFINMINEMKAKRNGVTIITDSIHVDKIRERLSNQPRVH